MSMGNLFKALFRSGSTGTVIVNGKEYRGNSVSISGDNHGQVIVDGVVVSDGAALTAPISIAVHGDISAVSGGGGGLVGGGGGGGGGGVSRDGTGGRVVIPYWPAAGSNDE